MADREVVTLGFEGGLSREYDTQLASKAATRLINWQPQPDGALRVRRAWERGSLTGKPLVAEVGSMGIMPIQEGLMTPIRRQRKKRLRKGASLLSTSSTWRDETLPGSLLLAILSFTRFNQAGTHDPTSAVVVTPPAGWNPIATVHSPDVPASVTMRIYSIENADARDGEEIFSFDTGVTRAAIEILEWRGIAQVAAQDVLKTASGSSVKPDTDFSVTTDSAVPRQLVVAAVAARTADKSIKLEVDSADYYDFRDRKVDPPDGPQHSTGREDYWFNMVVARKTINQEGPQRFQGHYDATEDEDDASSVWVAALVTFKVKERSDVGDKDYYVVDNVAADAHTLYSIDRDAIDTGAWTEIDTMLARKGSAVARPLCYAAGLGGLLISSLDIRFGVLRGLVYFDGEVLIRINRSPPTSSLALHNSRFYAGGIQDQPNYLFYSALGDPTMWNLDEWYIEIGSDSERMYDIAAVNEGLLIAKRDSLFLFAGNPRQGQVLQLAGGGGMAGRCICPIPGGAIVAGKEHIWLYEGGAPSLISRSLDDWWVNDVRTHVFTAYVNGLVYISGADEDTCVVYDTRDGVWWTDQPPVPVKAILGSFNRELLAGATATPDEFVMFQRHPGSDRERDFAAETFEVRTQEYMLGSPSRPVTPLWLYIAYSKRNYQAGHPAVNITPIYDGEVQTTRSITEAHPGSGAVLGSGDHRIRLDVGVQDRSAVHKCQFLISYEATVANTTVFDIEAIELVYESELPR